MLCNICPRKCNIERDDLNGGFCGTGLMPKIARVAPHYDEEPPISGTKGAGTIFFSGCNLRCVFCQNYDISASVHGKITTPYQLSEEYRRLESMGVHNIELVTPTHYTDAVIESLNIYKPSIPVIYNSSGYDSVESLRRLEGYIDIYLPDMKYSDNALAQQLSNCTDYVDTAVKAIDEMIRQQGCIETDGELIKKGVIIRHLVLPSHTKNSLGVLELIKERWGTSVPVSLMAQYTPAGRAAEYPDINRGLTAREYRKVLDKLYSLCLDGFAQELSSADKKYVPDWDYGV